jgi:ABC-type molybdenum transport system ATPase subunit/photorepair protein PhrA
MNPNHDSKGRFARGSSGSKLSSGKRTASGAALPGAKSPRGKTQMMKIEKSFSKAIGRRLQKGITTGVNAGGFPTVGVTDKKAAAKGLKQANTMTANYKASKAASKNAPASTISPAQAAKVAKARAAVSRKLSKDYNSWKSTQA